MRRTSANADAILASFIVYAYGSTPVTELTAGAAIIGYPGDAAQMVEFARPVRANCKMTSDLAAILMAIDFTLQSGVPSALIAFWNNHPLEKLLVTRSASEQEGGLSSNMLRANRDLLETIMDKLELARRTRTTITFENRYNRIRSPEEEVIGSMKFRSKQLALRAAHDELDAMPTAQEIDPVVANPAPTADLLGLSAHKWSALVENLVEFGTAKSSPRDQMIAELSIRRAMGAFHQTLAHVRAA
jgi:hypothetical protein